MVKESADKPPYESSKVDLSSLSGSVLADSLSCIRFITFEYGIESNLVGSHSGAHCFDCINMLLFEFLISNKLLNFFETVPHTAERQ